MIKRITAPFYTERKVGLRYLFNETKLPDGSLYARGRYKTKIKPNDLPEYYVYGMVFKVNGYISVLGIKDIVYKPNYRINHLHRDDFLYISYNLPIRETVSKTGYVEHWDYDAVLWGGMIVTFIREIRKHGSYDIEPIADEVKKKERFFLEKYPEECINLSLSNLLE